MGEPIILTTIEHVSNTPDSSATNDSTGRVNSWQKPGLPYIPLHAVAPSGSNWFVVRVFHLIEYILLSFATEEEVLTFFKGSE